MVWHLSKPKSRITNGTSIVDPCKWKLELERIAPHFHNVKVNILNYGHLKQLTKKGMIIKIYMVYHNYIEPTWHKVGHKPYHNNINTLKHGKTVKLKFMSIEKVIMGLFYLYNLSIKPNQNLCKTIQVQNKLPLRLHNVFICLHLGFKWKRLACSL